MGLRPHGHRRRQPLAPGAPTHRLSEDAGNALAAADTCFVATIHPGHGADVSHRGGRPGFLECLEKGTLVRIPDFQGNGMFNTFGNLELDSRAGLTVPLFETGGLLQLSGRGAVDYDPPPELRQPMIQRNLEFRISRVLVTENAARAPPRRTRRWC